MKHARSTFPKTLRRLALAGALLPGLLFTPAFADDYSDVSQLLRSGKFNDALSKADQYLQGKPRDPQMRFIKGVIQSEAGKPFDAISTFTKLTEDFPELPEPYNNLAVLYASQNQLEKARTALEMAIRTNPSYTTAHENLGDVYAKLASQAYAKALQLDANNSAVQPKLALIRELFAPGAKGQRPGAAATSTSAAVASMKAPAAPAASAPAPIASLKAPMQSGSVGSGPAPAAVAPATPAPASATVASPPPPVVTPVAPAVPSAATKEVEAAVYAWAAAWAAKDMPKYLAAYGKNFDPQGSQSRQTWEEERRKRIVGKTSISVKLRDLTVAVKGNEATAKFKQEYVANTLSANSRKTLELVKTGERWVIVKESAGA